MDQETQTALKAEFREALPRILSGEEDREWRLGNRARIRMPTCPAVTRAQVLDSVCEATGLSLDVMLAKRRSKKPVDEARKLAYFLMRELCQTSRDVDIARTMNKDHSVVKRGISRYLTMRSADPDLLTTEMRARELLGDKS